MRWRHLIGIALLTTILSPVWAVAEAGLQIHGRVNDYAQVITEQQRRQLHQLLSQHRFTSGNFLVVVTLEERGDGDESVAAQRLWQQWDRKDKERSGMLVLFKAQQSAAIVVGDALSGKLDAAKISRIIHGEVASALQGGDFDSAAIEGVKAMISDLSE